MRELLDRVAGSREAGLSILARGHASLSRRIGHHIQALTFRPYRMTKEISGQRIELHIDSLVAGKWYDRKHAWPELRWVVRHMIRPGGVVADCGAHIGLTSCLFAWAVGSAGHVFAFEALPSNAATLQRNVELNGLSNVTAENLAVSKECGELIVSDYPNAAVQTGTTGVRVPATSLDAYFDGRRAPDILKIDVEGHELAVLKGAGRILSTGPDIDLEVHPILVAEARREKTVADILNLALPRSRSVHVQLEVDGPIVPFEPGVHTVDAIARQTVVHLFVRGSRR